MGGLDDAGFKKALTDTTLRYPLVHCAKWRMNIDRRNMRVTVTELLPSGLFGRVFNIQRFSRDGLYNFLSQFFINEEVFAEAMKLTVSARLDRKSVV